MIEGVPADTWIELTTPVTEPTPLDGLTVTVEPIKPVACMFCKSDCISCDSCNELNCASCAAKSVSLWGLSGSCELICVTRSCRKSAWSNDCPPAPLADELDGVVLT